MLIPPLKTSGINVKLARMYYQDAWFYRYTADDLVAAFENKKENLNCDEV